ncbi:MAG TPA: hypothetical protein VJ570_06780 [Holophagaceae bacterium]|nr:hypothetical protein [Holophagaceae bacterium]
MSDLDLVATLEELEGQLAEGAVEGEWLAAWRVRFDAALAGADRGPDWSAIVARCQALAARLDAEAGRLTVERDRLRKEMDLQAHGTRALKGYKPI